MSVETSVTPARAPAWWLRSLLPIAAVIVLATTVLVGPFGFAAVSVAWWQIVRRIR